MLLDALLPIIKIGQAQLQCRFGTERDHAAIHVLSFLGYLTGDTGDFRPRLKHL